MRICKDSNAMAHMGETICGTMKLGTKSCNMNRCSYAEPESVDNSLQGIGTSCIARDND
jgi:hypothetical protein